MDEKYISYSNFMKEAGKSFNEGFKETYPDAKISICSINSVNSNIFDLKEVIDALLLPVSFAEKMYQKAYNNGKKQGFKEKKKREAKMAAQLN